MNPHQEQLYQQLVNEEPTEAASKLLKRTLGQFVIDYGWWYDPTPLPDGIEMGAEQHCHKNASDVASIHDRQSRIHKRPLTIRLFRDALRYFIDQRDSGLSTDWRDFVTKQITQFDVQYRHTDAPSRKDRLEKERDDLQIILEDAEGSAVQKGQAQVFWMDMTGQNQRQFFRRLKEMPENMRAIYESLPDGRTQKT